MTEENDIVRHRREKLTALRGAGESFPNDFRRSALAADLQARYGDVVKEELEAQRGVRLPDQGLRSRRRIQGTLWFAWEQMSHRPSLTYRS